MINVHKISDSFAGVPDLWYTVYSVNNVSHSVRVIPEQTPVLCCDLIPVVLTACPLSAGLQTQSYGSSALGTQSNYNHFQPTVVCDGRGKCINKVDGDKKRKKEKENPQCVSEVALSFPLYILIPLELPRSWIPGLVSMSHVLFTYYSLRDIPSTHGEQGWGEKKGERGFQEDQERGKWWENESSESVSRDWQGEAMGGCRYL